MNHWQKPSAATLILADYAALLCFLFPIVLWGMFAAAALGLWPDGPRGGERPSQFFLAFAIVVSIVALPLLYWRLNRVYALFSKGVPVQGRLIRVWFMSDRGRIDYEYTYDGQTYQAGMALVKTSRTGELHEGQDVTILIDPSEPTRSIVPAAFGKSDQNLGSGD